MSKYKVGDIVSATVTGIEKYGIFVKLEDEYTGLIHISEISEKFVSDIYGYAGVDDTLYVKVLTIDEDNKRLSLSIKRIKYNVEKRTNRKKIIETKNGFNPLKDHLDGWIKEKLAEIDAENSKK